MTPCGVYKRMRRGEDIYSALTREPCAGFHKSVTILNRTKKGCTEEKAYSMRSEKVKSKTGKIVEGIPGGPYKSIKEAAFARKLKPSNVYNRISNGMSINEALIQNEESNAKKRVECYGKRHSSIKEFALYYDLPLN